MRVLVVGGAGYIGSHTVYALAEAGHSVFVIDNLQTGHRAALHPAAVLHEGDIRDEAFLESFFARESVEGVIHFAANSLVGESMQNPLKYYDNNVGGTCKLLSAMVKRGVRHIVFSSTAAVYGEPARVPIVEEDATKPTNTYGETKLAMEGMFRWTAAAHDLRYVSLRYFNACGAQRGGHIGEDHAPETHLIPIVLQAALGKREYISVFGDDYDTPDGTCVRDYIHVEDLAQAHILAMEHLLRGGQSAVCNLGNGVGHSVKEVIAAAERVVGREIPTRMAPRRAGDPARLVASSERAKALLGWQPCYQSMEDIVSSAWAWHEAHPDGYPG